MPKRTMHISELIQRIIDKQGSANLRNVAHDIGVSASTLCRIVNGTNVPDIMTVIRVCRWLGVDQIDISEGNDYAETTSTD